MNIIRNKKNNIKKQNRNEKDNRRKGNKYQERRNTEKTIIRNKGKQDRKHGKLQEVPTVFPHLNVRYPGFGQSK